MSTKVLMDVEEYLHTSFEPDCEYLDGEIVARNMGEIGHSDVQGNVYRLLCQLRAALGILVLMEIRIQINERRYRVAGIAAWRNDDIGTGIPTVPPFLVVEAFSPEDRMVRVHPKIQEYRSIGVEWVWVIPRESRFMLFTGAAPRVRMLHSTHKESNH